MNNNYIVVVQPGEEPPVLAKKIRNVKRFHNIFGFLFKFNKSK